MSLLQSLVRQHERMHGQGRAPEYGYSREPISFALVLTEDGVVVDARDIRDTSGKTPRPQRIVVPRPAGRTSGVASNSFWDKTSYALGVTRDRETDAPVRARRGEHEAFKAAHTELLKGTEDIGLRALRTFLERWTPEAFEDLRHASDMLDANVVFQVDGTREYVHERPAARQLWLERLAAVEGERRMCLATGRHAAVARRHPPIKGVRGAQSSGAYLVSFNLDAFESFGRKQGDNAPVSEAAAFAYTTSLNTMLAPGSGHNLRIGDTTTVFWAEAEHGEADAAAAEDLFTMLLEPPSDREETVAVGDTLAAIAEGRPLADVRPDVDERTRFCVLGLAPNAARLAVRFWHEDSVGAFARRIGEHWRDLRIEPAPWRGAPPIWSLLYETAPQHRAENIPAALGGQLMRAILTGARYPHSLLAAVVARMRADKDVNGRRAAICKACLARDYRLGFEQEDVAMGLDRENDNPAYLLGRLFALYENLQRAALGRINATIKDRYFGAASASPASVFPLLERGSAAHLASLRKSGSGGLGHWFDREIDAVLGRLGTAFPRSLRLEEQGRFAIGYHHQRAHRGSTDGQPADQTEEERT